MDIKNRQKNTKIDLKCDDEERQKKIKWTDKVLNEDVLLRSVDKGRKINPLRLTKVTGLDANLERTVRIGRRRSKTGKDVTMSWEQEESN